MKKIIGVVAFLGIISLSSMGYGATVEIPYALKAVTAEVPTGDKLSIEFEVDSVSKRNMKKFGAQAKADIAAFKFIYTTDYAIDFYATLGNAMNIEYKYDLGTFDLDDQMCWGVGLNWVIFIDELEDLEVWPFLDLNYREITGMGYNSLTAGGVSYSKSQLLNTSSADWNEWQGALGIGKNFEACLVYLGIKYSDVQASARATAGGTVYDLARTQSDDNVGVFIGLVLPIDKIKVAAEVRFIDESAYSIKATYKF